MRLLVDVEALLANFLRAQEEVTALVADRVWTDLPNSRSFPLVLLQRIGGSMAINRPAAYLDRSVVQLDSYGGTHKQAFTVMATCCAVLSDRLVGPHPEGVVTGVQVDGIGYLPDPESDDEAGHARPRFNTTVTVLTHPS